jgi:hypothetical protein
MPDPFKSFEAALPGIIAERPKQIIRRRESPAADTFHAPQDYTAGPYTLRIEPMNQNGSEVWDEKGQVARRLFVALGYNLPRTVEEGGRVVPLFQLNDEITDQDDNRYTVSAPQYCEGKMVQLTLALRG